MSNYTFLTKEQCFGEEKLDIFKKRGIKAPITDFSILLGGLVSRYHMDNDNSLDGRLGFYWTKSYMGINAEKIVCALEHIDCNFANRRTGCGRPVLMYSNLYAMTNGKDVQKANDGVFEIEYGFYPQKAAQIELQETLEREFQERRLIKTGNTYTSDLTCFNDYENGFKPRRHEEYEYNGRTYIRISVSSNYGKDSYMLSNGKKYQDGDNVWIEVLPVKWLVDQDSKLMVTEKLIFSGVQFNHDILYQAEDFNTADIKKFMNQYMSKELVQARKIESNLEQIEEGNIYRQSRLQRMNPDKTQIFYRKKMTDTEIIKNWIEAGESVLLRGPSGIGKTTRIKSLYPDLIYMKLTNNMFPEKIVGSVNLQTGESIPPDFAKIAIMQEATSDEKKLIQENIQNIYDIADQVYERSKQSNKKVVILLDELLNVKPAVQSLVYTLVLNRIVEIGKGLKLPNNVVVVATGNQKKYSSVAEELAEPLEKRFDHILDMKPKVGEWLTEYAIPHKVHPSVVGYMLLKYTNSGKSENIQDIGYFFEEPEVGEKHLDAEGCRGRTNDPRGWTSISNTLYNFEKNLKKGKYKGKNVEDIFERSIYSKLRDEWATEFVDFYNLPTLTPEEIVQGMGKGYTQEDLPNNLSERFAFMTALITAKEDQIKECREFVRKYCDPEYLAIYDIYWAGDDERKMEKISELQEMDIQLHSRNENRNYVKEGFLAFKKIGTMYSNYLGRNHREIRGEESERTPI